MKEMIKFFSEIFMLKPKCDMKIGTFTDKMEQ